MSPNYFVGLLDEDLILHIYSQPQDVGGTTPIRPLTTGTLKTRPLTTGILKTTRQLGPWCLFHLGHVELDHQLR